MTAPGMQAIGPRRTAPFCGDVRIMAGSGLRKLMRAARRGRVPAERIQVIVQAQESAARRPEAWRHSSARQTDIYRAFAGLLPADSAYEVDTSRAFVGKSPLLAAPYGAPC